jgi:AcrR family transcriptional regulator
VGNRHHRNRESPPKYRTQTRARIIEAAGREIDVKGLKSTSLSMACREAGVTTGAMYHYFRSKVALIDAVVDQHTDSVVAVADAAHDSTSGSFERLALFVVSFGRLLITDPLARSVARMAGDR